MLSQIPQSTRWMRIHMGMMKLGALDNINHLSTLPGNVILKARTTVRVLAKTVESATVNRPPYMLCCRIHVAVLGYPMKSKGQRKQQIRVMSKM